MVKPFNGYIDMKKTILTLTLLIVAACSIFFARCVFMPKHVKSASNETSTPDAAPPLTASTKNAHLAMPCVIILNGWARQNVRNWNQYGRLPRQTF